MPAYARDGYVLAPGFFTSEEIGLLKRAAKEDKALDDHAFARGDGEGGQVRLSLWNHPGDSLYGMFAGADPWWPLPKAFLAARSITTIQR